MKSRIKIIFAAGVCFLLTACAKEPEDLQKVNSILKEQAYVDVILGGGYHQEEVMFDQENDKAVIPRDAKWGRPSFRDESKSGIYYGESEGGELYDTDKEVSPELYLDFYLASIRNLNLTVGDVKQSGYVVQVVKRSQLELFEKELAYLTSVIMKDNYELTGVEIEFDKQCRPIRKNFQLQNIREDEMKKEDSDSEECTQEFSYEISESKFERAFKKVKAEIEQE